MSATILDYPSPTGRSTQDSQVFGELTIQVPKKDERHHGW